MGWLDELFGTGTKTNDQDTLNDQDIVMDMLKDSKFALSAMVSAISETSNPELRQILKRQMNEACKAHFSLSDIAIKNNWYKPNLTPYEQIQNDYQQAAQVDQWV